VKSFSFEDRQSNIKRFSQEKYDLFIIGGGINGAGVARDAALRGMKVGLIEGSDFASGTSSRSSKLIHGGIRYLENLEFKLVFEALNERQKLFEIAPHLVHPLRFMLPLYKGGRVGMMKMGLGMWLYDALSLFQAPEMHERLDPHQSVARMPSLQGQDLLGSYVYSDAYMDDDRLVHETLRSANAAGAHCANFVKAIGAELNQDGQLKKVICEDQITKQKFTVQARHFVSTVGPWTDELGQKLFPKWKKVLRPTKGVHLTFEKKRLPLGSAVVMAAEKRIVFGIPRHEMVIVGTTDTDYKGHPEDVVSTSEDVQYLLNVVHDYFPGAEIKASDIVASYAGVRPLVQDDSESEGKTSREHSIFTDDHGVTFVAGGKYTTYRLISEQVVDHALKYFSIEDRVRWNRCQTDQPINPLITEDTRLADFRIADRLTEIGHLTQNEAHLLVERHGLEAVNIWKEFGPLPYWELEAAHAIENTMCMRLVDFYSRRVPLFLSEVDHGISLIPRISKIFQNRMGWSHEKTKQEEKILADHMSHELAWRHKIV
jgi:glycerol-3-phosphate dehydrogenase